MLLHDLIIRAIKGHRKTLFIIIASIIVAITTYSLILPASTLEKREAKKQGGIDLGEASQELSCEADGYKVRCTLMGGDNATSSAASLNRAEDSTDHNQKEKQNTASGNTGKDGISFDVQEITKKDEDHDLYVTKAEKAVTEEFDKEGSNKKIKATSIYDITLIDGGEEIEPENGASVKFEYDKIKKMSGANDVSIVHFTVVNGKEEAEVLDPDYVSVEAKKDGIKSIEFKAESFSVYAIIYTVDFHYEVDGETFDYSIEGGSSIGLKQLLKILKVFDEKEISADDFVADIDKVEFSDTSLVKVEKEDSDYKLISLEPFDTEETLTITMKDGEVFTIAVTDAQASDPLGLDNQTFVICSDGKAMNDTVNNNGQLGATNVSDEMSDEYAWTFEYDPTAFENTRGYYIKNGDQYIKIDNANYISLVDSKEEATPFKVTFDSDKLGTDTHDKGKYLIWTPNGGSNIYLDCRYYNFGMSTMQNDSSWMSLRSYESPQSDAGFVGTWDILSDGIVLKMFDYSGTINNDNIDKRWGNSVNENDLRNGTGINAGRGLLFTGSGMIGLNGTSVSKINQFTGEWNQSQNVKQYNKMANQGIVDKTLNADGYPVLNSQYWQTNDTRDHGSLGYLFGAGGQEGVTAYEGANNNGLQGFFRKDENNYYYYDSEWNYARLNDDNDEILLYSDTYKKDTPTDGVERKEKIGFFPFTDYDKTKREEKGPSSSYYNHQFGTSMHTDFFYPTGGKDPETNLPMKFEFSGDDDVWVFVDGVLVLDMGGVHQPVSGTVDFSTQTTTIVEYDYNGNRIVTTKTFAEMFAGTGKTFSTKNMSKHSLDFFYLERGGCDSNCSIKFNLLVTKTLYLKKEIEGLEYFSEEDKAKYLNKEFTYELNTRDTSNTDDPKFYLFNTNDTENVNTSENYTTRLDADGHILEQGFPIKDGQITIKNGETVAISKLPPTIAYYVGEEKTEVMDRFKTPRAVDAKEKNIKLSNGKSARDKNIATWKTGTQNIKSNDTVKYYNRIPLTNIEVIKDWIDDEPVDHSGQTVRFTIKATIPGEGTSATPVPYPISAVDDKTFTMSAGDNWRRVIENLPDKTPEGVQITYTVDEEPIDGYVSNIKVTTVSDSNDSNKEMKYTIENRPFKLKVKKNWVGDWTNEDKTKVKDDSGITVTLKRYKLVDKANLTIKTEVTKPEGFNFKAEYSVFNEDGTLVTKATTTGDDIVLSLPDGTYTVTQTTRDPESGFDISHDPQSRSIGSITVSETESKTVTFESEYIQHMGKLAINSTVTDPTMQFDASYEVYDQDNVLVATVPYAQVKNGVELDVPVGTYRVVENITTTPPNCTLKSTSTSPDPPVQTVGRYETKQITFNKTYEEIIDSNNTFEIRQWDTNGVVIDQGKIPEQYPAGTKIRLSFYCYNGGWAPRDVRDAIYNGQTQLLQYSQENYNGEYCVKYWVDYTLVQDQKMLIVVNANPYDNGNANKVVPGSLRIEVISNRNLFAANSLRMKKSAGTVMMRGAAQYADRSLSNEGTMPDTTDKTKKYVLDSTWSKEVTLTGDTWELEVEDGIVPEDENGNPYCYFIDSAVEHSLRQDSDAVIDKDGQNKLLVSEQNIEEPLTLTNTLNEIVLRDIVVKKAGYDTNITQLTPLGGVTFQLLHESSGFPSGDGSFGISDAEKLTGHSIAGLEQGETYTLRETVAPAGYNKMVGDIQFRIGETGIELITESDHVSVSTGNTFEITVINQAGAELPSAGGPGTTWIYLIGALLAIGCAVALISKQRCMR